MQLAESFIAQMPLAQTTEGPSSSLAWGIVLFFTILGLLVTLSPPRRTYEVKKPKEE